jgi:hypothetical protein
MKGIIICNQTGIYLVDLILDSEINPVLFSSFVGALGMFGNENMGKIDEIIIKGLDIQMIIVNKYDLFLIAIMDKHFVKNDIHSEAEKALDLFYSLYKSKIEKCDPCQDINEFIPFKKELYQQIKDYAENINKIEKNSMEADFGFFTDAIAKMRSD